MLADETAPAVGATTGVWPTTTGAEPTTVLAAAGAESRKTVCGVEASVERAAPTPPMPSVGAPNLVVPRRLREAALKGLK